VRIDWWTLGFQAINFLILAWLLQRFLYQPVMRVVAARQAQSDRLIADAEAGRRKAAEIEAEVARRRDAMQQEREALLAAARETAEKEAEAEREAARGRAGQVLAEADARARREAEEKMRDLRRRAASLAATMAGRLARSTPPPPEAFLDRLGAALAGLPEPTRATLRSGPLEVATAAPLDAAGQNLIRRWLAANVGKDATPDFAADPSLIAGVELRAPHAVLRSNWAADLDTLATEAARDDGAV
jgi:F-type H+-transporting ATPase subunit b